MTLFLSLPPWQSLTYVVCVVLYTLEMARMEHDIVKSKTALPLGYDGGASQQQLVPVWVGRQMVSRLLEQL